MEEDFFDQAKCKICKLFKTCCKGSLLQNSIHFFLNSDLFLYRYPIPDDMESIQVYRFTYVCLMLI